MDLASPRTAHVREQTSKVLLNYGRPEKESLRGDIPTLTLQTRSQLHEVERSGRYLIHGNVANPSIGIPQNKQNPVLRKAEVRFRGLGWRFLTLT